MRQTVQRTACDKRGGKVEELTITPLEHIGVDAQAPAHRPRAGRPLGNECDAPVGARVEVEPRWLVGSVIRRLKGLDFLSVYPRHRPSSLI